MAPFAPLRVTCLQHTTALPPYRLTALPSRHAPTPPRTTRAQVRRCVAGRFRRRPPRRRDHSPPPRRSRPSWSSPRWRGLPMRSWKWRNRPGAASRAPSRRLIARLRARHAEVARALLPGGRLRADVLALHQRRLRRARGAGAGPAAAPRADPAHHRLPGLPRRAAERAAGRRRARGRRAPAPATWTRLDLVHTDAAFGQAAPDYARTDRAVAAHPRARCSPAAIVPVVPGFIGATPEGEVATLGRGGSDLTATLLARALGAARVSLWKDVPGLLTADPRVVPDARVIPQLHAREAAELAYYGAKVLHPRALIPVDGAPDPGLRPPVRRSRVRRDRGLRAGGRRRGSR